MPTFTVKAKSCTVTPFGEFIIEMDELYVSDLKDSLRQAEIYEEGDESDVDDLIDPKDFFEVMQSIRNDHSVHDALDHFWDWEREQLDEWVSNQYDLKEKA